jgi:hypothetical protein
VAQEVAQKIMLREKIKLLGAFFAKKFAQTFSLHFVQGNYQVLIH